MRGEKEAVKQEKSREAILNHLEQKAGDYEELFGSCAQGTLLALQEEFQIGNVQTLKAATAMPGMALRGETCGAVIGAIMALGMAFGREKHDDFKAVRRTTSAARKLCKRFEEEFGSCNCRDVQHHIFGRSFDLTDSNDMMEFVKADAAKKCRAPSQRAARIAGELILDGLEKYKAESSG
ncbi:MAG: C-GCAxxG-C-C family protein [Chloroflexi bacterium]|nr:C-GCAxxG-C-C family protein [Chloroflexota bacterium]